LESTIAIAQQHAHRGAAAGAVGHGEVRLTIEVEVSYHDEVRVAPSIVVDSCLEGPIAVAQQHAHVAPLVGDSDVGLAIPIKVTYRYANGIGGASVVADCSLESPISVAQQHSNVAAVVVGHGQVGLTIPVEVAHG